MRLIHLADTHFSNNSDKLPEVIRTTNFILEMAQKEVPDAVVIAGDTVDEMDGRIRLDSDCARAAISFIQRCADIAPVVIVRGTKSHDRETPYLFSCLRGRFPIHVASSVQQVALVGDTLGVQSFVPFSQVKPSDDVRAVFSLVPSLDKAQILAQIDTSIKGSNAVFRELVHDLFAGFGLINDTCTAPTILVTHGMLTGATFSSGQTAVGEDLEFGLSDLHAAKADYTALGHVHKFQTFPGNVVYSGSPGRLNFGEQEEKGFVMVEFEGRTVSLVRFIQTPARRFVFGDLEWSEEGGLAAIWEKAHALVPDCADADVRFRFSVPEEDRANVDRQALETLFLLAGAARAKIEMAVIPKQRTRAAGISRKDHLPDKVLQWGETVSEPIPADVLALAGRIEGVSVEELLQECDAEVAAVGEAA